MKNRMKWKSSKNKLVIKIVYLLDINDICIYNKFIT